MPTCSSAALIPAAQAGGQLPAIFGAARLAKQTRPPRKSGSERVQSEPIAGVGLEPTTPAL